MSRSLSDLIADDLSNLAFLGSDVVASLESIQWLIALYKHQRKLSNISFVHKDKLAKLLEEQGLDQDPSAHTTPAHYQYFVEIGSRSLREQRQSGSIHYCAMDIYVMPGKRPIAFVADHYQGFKAFYSEFSDISKKIDFVIVGGSKTYQADKVHCPIFTLRHLLLTASDAKLPILLRRIVDIGLSFYRPEDFGLKEAFKFYPLHWNQLPGQYILGAQSVGMIWDYVDSHSYHSARRELATLHGEVGEKNFELIWSYLVPNAWAPAPELVENRFDLAISPYLLRGSALNPKIQNKFIKYEAARFAGEGVLALQSENIPNLEEFLIDTCYRTNYPKLHQELHRALIVQNKFNKYYKKTSSHPLFELAFYHADVLEPCLNNRSIGRILKDEFIQQLILFGLLDPKELLKQIMLPGAGEREPAHDNRAKCNLIIKKLETIQKFKNLNSKFIDAIVERLIESGVKASDIFELLVSANTASFCQKAELLELFAQRHIDIQLAKKIISIKINFADFNVLSLSEKILFLKTTFETTEKQKTLCTKADEVFDGLDKENISVGLAQQPFAASRSCGSMFFGVRVVVTRGAEECKASAVHTDPGAVLRIKPVKPPRF